MHSSQNILRLREKKDATLPQKDVRSDGDSTQHISVEVNDPSPSKQTPQSTRWLHSSTDLALLVWSVRGWEPVLNKKKKKVAQRGHTACVHTNVEKCVSKNSSPRKAGGCVISVSWDTGGTCGRSPSPYGGAFHQWEMTGTCPHDRISMALHTTCLGRKIKWRNRRWKKTKQNKSMSRVPPWLPATRSPYQTFLRQRGWPQALSG